MDRPLPRTTSRPLRVADAAALVGLLVPGENLFLPGSTAEVPEFTEALRDSGLPLAITASFVPGINPSLPLRVGATYTSTFVLPGERGAQAAGHIRHLPLSYAGFAASLQRTTFDTCLVHVSPPGADGLSSFGAAVEFTPIVARRARRILAVVNTRMPRIPGADMFDLTQADAVAEIDTPLREYDVGTPSEQAAAIAERTATFIEDGSSLQIGLGKVPDALLRLLTDRRGLKLHSGMLSDGARLLLESGSLDPRWQHTSCVHVGTESYYDWLADREGFAVRSCEVTHAPTILASLPRLVAVNSALTVDLFGQANLEMLDGRMISGVGGAADFARAASLSGEGVSIVALPSVSGREQASRIVPKLDGICSLARHDVEVVITEHGVADLRNLSVRERGERLAEIAAPQHRPALRQALHDVLARL
jgi:acyl-CoA hydrolase